MMKNFFRERGFRLTIRFRAASSTDHHRRVIRFADPDMPLRSNLDVQIEARSHLEEAGHESPYSQSSEKTVMLSQEPTSRYRSFQILERRGAVTLTS